MNLAYNNPTLIALVIVFHLCCGIVSAGQTHVEPDKSLTRTLDEIVVIADRDFFKITGPNRFVYDVSKDSTLRNANTIDALKKVPILNARNTGEVNAMNGKPLVFKINGLRDPLLGNLAQALTSIPADVIKQIEFSNDNTGEGNEVIVVNIVTKGRLEGYRAQATSKITDHNWRNGIWGLTKVRRFSVQGSYFNTWEWGHGSTSGSEEYRFGTPDTYRYENEGRSKGYKVDLHAFESSASYDVDDRSFISISGTAMFKTDPHESSFSTNRIFNESGALAAMYVNSNDTRMKDAEYTASVKFERNTGDRRRPGNLNIGYQIYSRPFSSDAMNIYELTANDIGPDIDFLNLMDSRLLLNKRYLTNTLAAEWEKRTSDHVLINLYGRFRTRSESYENDLTMNRVGKDSESPMSEWFKTSLTEYWGSVTPKAAYFTNRWEVRGGVVAQAYRHRIKTSDRPETTGRSRFIALPFASTAFLTGKKMLLELSYNMSSRVPDITAMDPYMDRTVPGTISYGNPDLKPQMENAVKFDVSGKTWKLYSGGTVKTSYTKDIILSYGFVNDGVMHRTYGNIANRRSAGLSGYTSGRIHRNTYLRFNTSLDWIQYRAGLLALENQGWQFGMNARVEQELPWGITLDLSAYYNTRSIMLQGKGSHEFGYDIGLFRQFLNRRLTVILDAESFIPVRYKRTDSSFGPEYYKTSWNRTFNASFSLTVRFTFGKLKTDVKEGSISTANDDIKNNYSE